jgi:phosphoenolpyruvate synthase/pyruvate phosphate dikinase
MYSDVVLGLEHALFEDALEQAKEDNGFHEDTQMEAPHWQDLVEIYKQIVVQELGRPFPQDVHEQLWGAIGAVFDSWESERAKVYRRLNDIPASWGTAVNVQAMVFGNMGETSATGVAFTRDPATGESLLRRMAGQCAGRGRGRGHPHAAISDAAGPRACRRESPEHGRSHAAGLRRVGQRVRGAGKAL